MARRLERGSDIIQGEYEESGVGFWGFYFLAKFYLYLRGVLRLDFISNFFFLFFLLLPTPGRFKNSKLFSVTRLSVSVVLGVLLLWRDSWLPPFWETLKFIGQQGTPSGEYLYLFLRGFFNPGISVGLALLAASCAFLRSRIRFAPVIVVLLLIVPLREFGRQEGGMKEYLERFYGSEEKQVVRFPGALKEDFDIILLHVCSLSWDDLRAVGLEKDPFFRGFDYLFERYNSVTAYSNPSAVRLLRSNCGQERHDALYADAPGDCYLMDGLRRLGYKTYSVLNHDGKYYDFAKQVETLGHIDPPLLPIGLPQQAVNFDGSAIFDDYAVLENGFRVREQSGSARAALYYNTISLHDGAHRIGDGAWWNRERGDRYRESVQKLFGDFSRFFDRLAASGRNAVVFFVPEHGLGLRGSPIQVAGLRDIPLPSITTVPVGVKLIGKGRGDGTVRQTTISAPSSYLALSSLLAYFMERPPFDPGGIDPAAPLASLPKTEFVSENQTYQIVEREGEYFLRGKDQSWVPFSPVPASSPGSESVRRAEKVRG